MNQKFKRFVPENKKEKIIMASIILIILLLLIISLTAAININSLDDYDMSSVTLSDSTVTYDGEEHSLEIEGDLPEGVTASYTYNGEEVTGVTNAGTYTVVASFTGDTSSYNTISDIEATLTISTATLDTTDITLSDASYTYDGEEHSLEIEGELPEGVTASYTYEDEDVTGVTEIGEYSVEATLTSDNYSTVTLSATLSIIENDDYSYTINEDETSVTLTAYLGSNTDITTPTKIIEDDTVYSVTAIGDYCFSPVLIWEEGDIAKCENGDKITSVNISSGVTTFGDYCLLACTSLESITTPESLNSLGEYCLSECENLTSVTLLGSFTNLGWRTFADCTSLESITMPNTVEELDYACFGGCDNLVSVTLSSSLLEIGMFCFINCTSLESITIPESVTTLTYGCFQGCTSLTSVTFEYTTNEWYLTSTQRGDTFYLDVTDESANSTYLVETYREYDWNKVLE